MSSPLPDQFDDLIARALREQPEMPGPSNLAERAIQRARAANERDAALMRLGRRLRACSVMAAILIVAAIVGWWWNYTTLAVAVVELNSSLSADATGSLDLTSLGVGAIAVTGIGLSLYLVTRGGAVPPVGTLELE